LWQWSCEVPRHSNAANNDRQILSDQVVGPARAVASLHRGTSVEGAVYDDVQVKILLEACHEVGLYLQVDNKLNPEVYEKIATAVLTVAQRSLVDPSLIAREALGQIGISHYDGTASAMRDAAIPA
jgi:hypothetical protein